MSKKQVPRKETSRCPKCQILEKENLQLKKELKEIRDGYFQLIKETTVESFSERRVTLLKAQMLQLERQVTLLAQTALSYSSLTSQVNSFRASALDKISVNLLWTSVLTSQVENHNFVLKEAESLREEITKLRIKAKPDICCTAAYTGRYANEDVSLLETLVDNCKADLTSISWLEGQVSVLVNYLVQLEASLRVVPKTKTPTLSSIDPLLSNSTKLHELAKQSLEQASFVGQELLTLSLLIPGQLAHRQRKKIGINITQLLNELPPFLNKRHQGKELLEATVSASNQQLERLTSKVRMLEEELDHQRTLYEKHLEYFDTLFAAISTGRKEFMTSIREALELPLRNLVKSYQVYQEQKSLQAVLECLEVNVPTLSDTVDRLQEMSTSCLDDYDLPKKIMNK